MLGKSSWGTPAPVWLWAGVHAGSAPPAFCLMPSVSGNPLLRVSSSCQLQRDRDRDRRRKPRSRSESRSQSRSRSRSRSDSPGHKRSRRGGGRERDREHRGGGGERDQRKRRERGRDDEDDEDQEHRKVEDDDGEVEEGEVAKEGEREPPGPPPLPGPPPPGPPPMEDLNEAQAITSETNGEISMSVEETNRCLQAQQLCPLFSSPPPTTAAPPSPSFLATPTARAQAQHSLLFCRLHLSHRSIPALVLLGLLHHAPQPVCWVSAL